MKLPQFWESSFHCPHCGVLSEMRWGDQTRSARSGYTYIYDLPDLASATCTHCSQYSLWIESLKQMVFPSSGIAPLPNSDLPDDIKNDYMEARGISTLSPRGSAALLRLCIQKLCQFLGEPGKDINSDIAALVKKGLNPSIQRSLDVVRVIGNESVHPGTIDLRDDPSVARTLFLLVNVIADVLITQPKMIDEAYAIIPESKRKAIEKRDGK